jgi:GTPase SAR1 family protein
MIVIEGPDGVGKTTLAKALQREMNSAYVHYGPMPLWWQPHDYMLRHVRHAVYDRYHWSALAYASVASQPWRPDVEACLDIDEMLRMACKEQYATVLLYSSLDTWFDGLNDDLFTDEQVKTVNQEFIAVKHHFSFSWDIAKNGYPDARRVYLELTAGLGLKLDGS